MLNRFATLAAVCLLTPVAAAPFALAEPDPAPVQPAADAGPPSDSGAVPSEVPGILQTTDGWNLKVWAKDESQLAVPPLTTALSSREYMVGGTFTAEVAGK